jgi:hypothetical protein
MSNTMISDMPTVAGDPIIHHPVALVTSATAALTSTYWIPSLTGFSETIGFILPILGVVLVSLQIVTYGWNLYSKCRNRKH